MIAEEVKVLTTGNNASMWTKLKEDKLIRALQVGYGASKNGVKTPLFNLVREAIVDILQQGKMDSMLMGNIENLIQSERFEDAVTR